MILRVGFMFSLGLALALAACESRPLDISTSGAALQTTQHQLASPNAKKGAVLFVATGSDVYILTYPAGQLAGHLTLSAHALCADKKGNVFIPTVGHQIQEYSHDGALLQTLQAGDVAVACAVDPVTGNLAVANEGSGAGEV